MVTAIPYLFIAKIRKSQKFLFSWFLSLQILFAKFNCDDVRIMFWVAKVRNEIISDLFSAYTESDFGLLVLIKYLFSVKFQR